MSRCAFINLPGAVERRRSLEASFAAADHRGWTLDRFEALGPADVAQTPGAIKPTEKACFESHRTLIGQDLERDGHLFVTEDDALFARSAFGLVDAVFDQGADWDLLFTDIVTSDLALMIRLAKRRDDMLARGQYDILNLARRQFFSASAYVVRDGAKRRVHEILAAAGDLDTPYDIHLSDLCLAGRLKVAVCFPYVTTVGSHAELSQIQLNVDAIGPTLNAFRRLMFADRDLAACRAEIDQLQTAYCDEPSRLVGGIFAAIASPGFPSDISPGA